MHYLQKTDILLCFDRFSFQVQADSHAILAILLFVDPSKEQRTSSSAAEVYGSAIGQSCHFVKR